MWSRNRFGQEAKALVDVLSKGNHRIGVVVVGGEDDGLPTAATPTTAISSKNENRNDDFDLKEWRVVVDGDGDTGVIYLIHPSIIMIPTKQKVEQDDSHTPSATQYDDDRVDDDSSYGDDTILVDTAEIHIKNSDHLPLPTLKTTTTSTTISWYFSIVYSDTYQVPVLYFHVSDTVTGQPCSRTQVLKYLIPGHTNNNDNDNIETNDATSLSSWEFISQEPHPHTGFPSYFLHPCRTAERMKGLTSRYRRRKDDDKDDDDDDQYMNYLWAWMSMIFPAVGYSIPSLFYSKILNELCCRKRD